MHCCFYFLSCRKDLKEIQATNGQISGSVNESNAEEEGFEYQPTFQDYLFDHPYDSSAFISQTLENGDIRILKRYNTPVEFSHHLYSLVDETPEGSIIKVAFIVSPTALTSVDLEDWNLLLGEIYLYQSGELVQSTNNTRLVVKKSGKRYEMSDPWQKAMPPGSWSLPDAPACTDWYWTSWDPETGEVYDEFYLFTTCTNQTGGGFGTSTPPQEEQVTEEIVDKFPKWPVVKPTPQLTLISKEHIRVKNYKVPVGQPAIPSIIMFAGHLTEQFSSTEGWTWQLSSAVIPYTSTQANSVVIGYVHTLTTQLSISGQCSFMP